MNSQFTVAEDLKREQEEDAERDTVMLESEAIHFDPDDFQKKFKPLTLERFRLSDIQFYMNSVRIIAFRSEFLQRSKAMDDWAQRQSEAINVVRKSTQMLLSRRYTRKLQGPSRRFKPVVLERDFPGNKYAKRSSHQLTVEEKIAIVHAVVVDDRTFDDAARLHRVSKALAKSLVAKAKRNKKFLSDLIDNQKAKEAVDSKIVAETRRLLDEDSIVHKSS